MAHILSRRTPSIQVSQKEAGQTLIDLLSGRFTYFTRLEWEHHIQNETIRLNRKTARPHVCLMVGDLLEFYLNNIQEPPVINSFSIIHEDRWFLAVNKPGNLPCHPGGRYFNNSLWALLKSGRNMNHVGLVNRIDRETSGIVLIAKDRQSEMLCRREFENRRVKKRYLAVVEGCFPADAVTLSGYMGKDPDSPIRKKRRFFRKVPSEAGAKPCATDFKKINEAAGMSLVEAVPVTGRIHQIRATLSASGHPVVGDKIYGADETVFIRFIEGRMNREDRRRLRMPRQALHAAGLRLDHPRSGRALDVKAPLPEDMKRFLKE